MIIFLIYYLFMSNNYVKKNYHILTYLICYLSLIIGFFAGENVTTGPKADFFHTWDGAMEFNDDWLFSLLNFDNIVNYTRISPIYLLINLIFFPISIYLILCVHRRSSTSVQRSELDDSSYKQICKKLS